MRCPYVTWHYGHITTSSMPLLSVLLVGEAPSQNTCILSHTGAHVGSKMFASKDSIKFFTFILP